jgi:hypothetical protein
MKTLALSPRHARASVIGQKSSDQHVLKCSDGLGGQALGVRIQFARNTERDMLRGIAADQRPAQTMCVTAAALAMRPVHTVDPADIL